MITREDWPTNLKVQQRIKSANYGSELWIEHKLVREIDAFGNVDYEAIQKIPYEWPEELNEAKLSEINDQSSYDEKEKDVPEEVMPAKSITVFKKLHISQHWKHKG